MKFRILTLVMLIISSKNLFSQNATDSSITKINYLGEVTITDFNYKSCVNSKEIKQYNKLDISQSLNVLPSMVFNNAGARNESTIYLRGFDTRSVPIYIDGIPVYVAYDGNIDLGRFTTFDLSKIEVSKGYTSILYGANTLGGAINLVTLKPTHKLEIEAIGGYKSSNGYKTALNIGSKIGKFYLQGSVSRLKQDYYMLSEDFKAVKNENGGKRENSFSEDNKMNFKIGFTPNKTDEYNFNYIYQTGIKGNPIYAGEDPLIKTRYWQWPHWDKESYYFISKTKIGSNSYVKSRLFFDKFKNQLNAYDNDQYNSQTLKSSFQSFYNDKTYGANIEFGTQLIKNNDLKFATHYKNDNHKEYNLGEPERTFEDYTLSIGIEDIYNIKNKLFITPGISFNNRKSVKAQDYDAKKKIISNYENNEKSVLNLQCNLKYNLSNNLSISGTVANRSRFANMKDRYSYKMGIAIPNPTLKPERVMSYELASNVILFNKLTLQPALFYNNISDVIQEVNNIQPNISQKQNTGNAEFIGGEINIIYQPLKILTFNSNYSYIERKNLTKSEIKFTDVPNNKVFVSGIISPIKYLDVIISGEYNSDRFSTSYGTKAKEFTLLNANLNIKPRKLFMIEAGVNNIFDANYTYTEGYPVDGRNYFISLIVNFKK